METPYALRSRTQHAQTADMPRSTMATCQEILSQEVIRASANSPSNSESTQIDTSSIQTQTRLENPTRIPFNSLLPEFSGKPEENVEYFFSLLEQVAQIAGWPTAHLTIILKSRLKGEAQSLVSSDKNMQLETDYPRLKQMILDHFLKQKSLLQKYADFNSIVQTPNLNVKQLAQKIKSAAKIYLEHGNEQSIQEKSLVDKLLLTKFCDALRADIRWELRKFNPTSLDEAIQKAQLIEEANDDKAASVNQIQSSSANIQFLEILEAQAKCQEKIFEEIRAEINNIKEVPTHIPTAVEHTKIPSFCYFCGKAGHFMNNCFQFNAIQRQMNSGYQGMANQYVAKESPAQHTFRGKFPREQRSFRSNSGNNRRGMQNGRYSRYPNGQSENQRTSQAKN